jgi:NAD(P)-dependent dehydrogenase (short-subunit alcohol dehydrogenase family)
MRANRVTAVSRSYGKIEASGRLAQLVARFLHTEEVIGSSPVSPTMPSIVVTGASTGIGRATVAELVAADYQVWATVRTQADADSLTAEHGTAVTPLLVDLLDHDSVRAAGARVVAAGPLRGLVNNAGVALPAPLETMPIEVFERQLDINLVGQLLMTQVMLPALLADGDARITFIGSIAGRIAPPILGAYATSKHGVVGLAGSLRAELAPYGVQVCVVEPGVIATPIWERGAAAGDDLMGTWPAGRYAAQIAEARESAANGSSGADPRLVARVVLATMTRRRPRPRQTVGRDGTVVALITRVLPFRAIYRLTAGKP